MIVKKYLLKVDTKIELIQLSVTARTAKEAADSLKQKVGSIIKSLLFKTKDDKFYLCLVSGDKYISEKKLSKLTKKEIIKASAEEVKNQTGYSIGGVPPIAHKKTPTKVFIDKNLNNFDIIYAAAGHPYVIFATSFTQICKITNAIESDIVKD